MNNIIIGKRIAALRQEHSLTQQQLATLLNVSHQAVSKWESGASMPDMGTLLELTRLFGITVEELTAEENAQRQTVAEETPSEEENPKQEAKSMTIAELLRMAPFMSKEAVGEIAMRIETKMTAYQLARLAPFVPPEVLEALMEKHAPELSWDSLRRLAPFLGKEYVDRMAREIADGVRTVLPSGDDLNRTFNEIGKAFDGISKDMGKAFDEIGRGMEKTVRKAIRFGGRVMDEVTNAIDDLSKDADCAFTEKKRSERAKEIRGRAFERALSDGRWDWLGAHMDEIRGDGELMLRIAEKAKAEGRRDWIYAHMSGYADDETIDAAIRDGKWDWLGDNAWQFEESAQRRVIEGAIEVSNWEWLEKYADMLSLGEAAYTVAEKAMLAGQTALAERLAEARLTQAQKNDLLKTAYEADNEAALTRMLDLADEDFRRWMLLDLADAGKWAQVEKYADEADVETIEALSEKAVEQGNFEALDMLDRYM